MPNADYCYLAHENLRLPSGQYVVVCVTENQLGFQPVLKVDTLEDARANANELNKALGLSYDRIRQIQNSAMRVSGHKQNATIINLNDYKRGKRK